MKKNIKYLVIAFAAALSITSCNDALEIVQDGELSQDAVFSSPANMENYLNGSIYGSLDNSSQMKFTSVFTDELRIGPSSTGADFDLYRYIITPNSGYAGAIWSQSYTTIRRVNTLIKGASTITPASGAQTLQYNNTLGEARAIRALAYMNLLAYFSPNMKDNGALGVMLTTEPAIVGEKLPRVTNGEIWAVVESDLDFAYNNISPAHQALPATAHNSSFYIRKAAVQAIRARMYVYRGNYTLAAQYAQSAITESGLGLSVATPIPSGTVGSPAWNTQFYNVSGGTSPYRKMLVDVVAATDENIFKLSRPATGSGGIGGLWTTNTTDYSGAPWWTLGLNVYNAITSLPNDIRRYAFIDPTSKDNFWVIDKYPGKGTTPLKNDVKMFRISEMYLILAEAAAQSNLTQAADYVRQVRQARVYSGTVTAPVYATKIDALRDILKERRVELVLEGHRYIDLKRLGQEAGVGIDRNTNDDWVSSSTPLTLSVTDYRFTLPIPASEIAGNPGIQQNQGY